MEGNHAHLDFAVVAEILRAQWLHDQPQHALLSIEQGGQPIADHLPAAGECLQHSCTHGTAQRLVEQLEQVEAGCAGRGRQVTPGVATEA